MNGMLAGFQQAVSTITRILIAPTLNARAALLLYAMIAIILLLILVIGLMFVMGAPGDTADRVSAGKRKDAGSASQGLKRREETRDGRRAPNPMSPRTRVLFGLGIAAALLGVWVVAGFTTSEPGFCVGCHGPTSDHLKADKGSDPHTRVDCVSCHESGGVIGRYAADVPFRLLHLAVAYAGAGNRTDYGQVTTRACSSCHAASLVGAATNTERGLKVSHVEPLAASASCLDCHTMSGGIVSVHNVGMTPCLRCHDGGKASSACATCHVGTAAAAARARTVSFQTTQIREVTCGGCHNEKRDCDTCHGIRLPHTTKFMNGAHARAAAVDFWYNGGKTCSRCHTASRRPCTRCHTVLIGKAHGSNLRTTHQGGSSTPCNTCHQQYAPIATRDFCKDVCHSPAAIANSPR